MNINYKLRLQFLRKLDIITDVYNKPEEIFEKSVGLFNNYLKFKHTVLYIKEFDNKIKKHFSDSKAEYLDSLIPDISDLKRKLYIIKDQYHIYIRPLILKNGNSQEKKKIFGYFIFFYDKELTFPEKLLLRDFIDFINDSLFMLGKLSKIKNLFSRYIPEELIKTMEKENLSDNLFKGVKNEVSVLFADVRGFTSFSESHTPEEVIDLLNNIFTHSVKCIFKHKGMIDKFIGDAVMGVFGAPVYYDKSYINVVKAAIDMQKLVKEKLKGQNIGIGIGINYGHAISGNIGTKKRMDYTVIGDTVNVASRLEGIARQGEIVFTENFNKLIKNEFKTKYIDTFHLKGKSKPVKIYKVLY